MNAKSEVEYHFRRLGRGLLDELVDTVSLRRSVTLLGPRKCGKRLLLLQLARRLASDPTSLVIELAFSLQVSSGGENAVRNLAADAARAAAPDFSFAAVKRGDLLEALAQLCAGQPRSVVLLASNVDCLPHHVAQMFLREVRALTEAPDSALTVVLTGEDDLSDLVMGPDSEFNCTQQFILQGFDFEEFLAWIIRGKALLSLPFADESACLALLHERTGGNIRVARAAIGALLESCSHLGAENRPLLTPEKLGLFLDRVPELVTADIDVFYQSTRVIERTREGWQVVETLLDKEKVQLAADSPPQLVELAGMARREGDWLRFASPIMEKFARLHYDARRFGELHASCGDWPAAFDYFARAGATSGASGCGLDDRIRLSYVIERLIASMHAETTKSGGATWEDKLASVKNLFTNGCKLILGIPAVSFWNYHRNPETAKRNLRCESGCQTGSLEEKFALAALHCVNWEKIGRQDLGAIFGSQSVVAVLPSLWHEDREAVVVSDQGNARSLSRERAALLDKLVDQFGSAYEHTNANRGTWLHRDARKEHLKIATDIFNSLGETVNNPRDALIRAGEKLLRLHHYRRIAFALVDVGGQRIRGIADCNRGLPGKIDAETDYPIDPKADIQPWVVDRREPVIVDDWRKWDNESETQPRINLPLCRTAGTKPCFAVVPWFVEKTEADGTSRDEVFGTFHIERDDGRPPSPEDIADLIEFGRQLAAAVQQSERVYVLSEALHLDVDSVAIIDHEQNVIFGNKSAANRLKVRAGLHDWHEHLRIDQSDQASPLAKLDFAEIIATNASRSVYDGIESEGRHEAISCIALRDWRIGPNVKHAPADPQPNASGAVLTVRDLAPLHRVFSALQEVAVGGKNNATTTEALLRSARTLGFPRARLYLFDPNESDTLVSVLSGGLAPAEAMQFDHGNLRIKRGVPRDGSFECFVRAEPRVFCWNPTMTASPTGVSKRTRTGIVFHEFHCEDYYQNPWKRPGVFWIDLPLVTADRRQIGKLTIDCGADYQCDLTPEQLELLRLFSALVGALLDALDKEKWIRAAADKAMATCAHNIRTKFAALDGLAELYRHAAPGNEAVERVVRIQEPIVRACFDQVTRITETYYRGDVQRAPVLVKPFLERILTETFPCGHRADEKPWRLECAADLVADLDEDRVGMALAEMFHNSREMITDDSSLRMELSVQPETRLDGQWIRVYVRDNGPGVPESAQPWIFDAMYSARPNGKKGTGLGLTFVRRVIEAHDGRISLNPRQHPGAEFVIEFPVLKRSP